MSICSSHSYEDTHPHTCIFLQTKKLHCTPSVFKYFILLHKSIYHVYSAVLLTMTNYKMRENSYLLHTGPVIQTAVTEYINT